MIIESVYGVILCCSVKPHIICFSVMYSTQGIRIDQGSKGIVQIDFRQHDRNQSRDNMEQVGGDRNIATLSRNQVIRLTAIH